MWPRATAPVAVPSAGSPSTTSQLSRTLKPNQSKQSRTERSHVPPGVCPTVSQDCRCLKNPFVTSSLLLSQGNPLSLYPAPKARLAGAQAQSFELPGQSGTQKKQAAATQIYH